MNRARLRELFDNAKADVRDYYDAQRDMLEAQRKLFDHLLDAATLIADDGGVIATTDSGVTVMRPPGDDGLRPQCAFAEGCENPSLYASRYCAAHVHTDPALPTE